MHENMIFSSNVPKKCSFQKKIALWYDLSCIIWKMFFFSGRYDIFFDGKWKMIFLKKYMEIWYFLYVCINVTNMILPFCKKNQRWSSPEKIHLMVIDILDRILERVPAILCTFMETLIGVFIYCFPVKKTQKTRNLIYRIEIWLLLQFIWLEIFYSEESLIVCTIQPSGVVFRGMPVRQLRKLFVH